MQQPTVLNMVAGNGYYVPLAQASTLAALLRSGECYVQPSQTSLAAMTSFPYPLPVTSAPIATPAPAVGAVSAWSHMRPGDKRSYGFPGIGDVIVGVQVWCIASGEIEFLAH